ncbi:MAG TPA: ABC transporter ATP-binding protein [Gemmataceae bacterium]|nr:ABC transporter ATP-binding protein [Gemmataceae bacterium]
MRPPLSAVRCVLVNSGRLLAAAWQQQPSIVIVQTLLSLLIAGLPFLQSGIFALLINELVRTTGHELTGSVAWLAILAVGTTVVPDALYAWKGFFDRKLHLVMNEHLELKLIERKGDIDVATYESPKFQDLLTKAEGQGIFPMIILLEQQFYNLQSVVGVSAAAVVLALYDWRIFFLVVVAAIPKFVLEAKYGHGVWSIYDANAEKRRRYADFQRHFHNLSELIELKLFQNVRYFLSAMRDLLHAFNEEQRANERRKLMYQLGAVSAAGIAIAVAVVSLIDAVVAGTLAVGTMTFVLGAIRELQGALSGFFLSLGHQYQHSLFTTNLFEIMDTPPAIPRRPNARMLSAATAPDIVLDHVSFAYPGTDKLILKNVSLTIPSGGKFALVGVNGSGKTTLVKLICRIYDPTEGRILVNGHDLRDLDLESWHHQMSVLFQDYADYHFLVKDVIAMGRRNGSPVANMDKVRQAARQSGAETFIDEWARQYEQMMGREFPEGIDPSKGQLQKLALARSFYRDPRLLILDEPTASIDAEAEARIFEELETLPRDKTVILISHRFSTVRKADRICVLRDGIVEEQGTHEELMRLGKIYARLFQIQAAGYQE